MSRRQHAHTLFGYFIKRGDVVVGIWIGVLAER